MNEISFIICTLGIFFLAVQLIIFLYNVPYIILYKAKISKEDWLLGLVGGLLLLLGWLLS